MTRVWIVTQGSYSDYRITKVFASKAAAQEYVGLRCADRWSEFNDPQEWDVLEAAPGRVTQWSGRVVVSADGSQIRSLYRHGEPDAPIVWQIDPGDADAVPARPRVTVRKADFPFAEQLVGKGGTELAVHARTEEAARKALMDRAYKIQAEKAGVA